MKSQYRQYLRQGEAAGMRYAFMIPRNAMTGISGARLGHMSGSSLDFNDYREYQPGDDLRSIDWGIYARTDKLTVKLYREEVTPHVDIVLDCSPSMALKDTGKEGSAIMIAAALATAAANAKSTFALWLTSRGCTKAANASLLPSTWDGIEFDSPMNPPECFAALPPAWRRRGVRVLISDLLWLGEPLQFLKRMADGAASVVVIQVLAAVDADPDTQGNVRLVDCETGLPLEIFADAVVLQQYREALARHQQNWQRGCRQVGATITTIIGNGAYDAPELRTLEELQILQAL
ncbi:MAG: DUF58 domain-containing protein [bacterium]